MLDLTLDELIAIHDRLNEAMLDGAAEDDTDPIVTAWQKVVIELQARTKAGLTE